MREYIITLDIGGTSIKYGAVSLQGEILFQSSIPSEAEKGAENLLISIVSCVEQILSSLQGDPLAIGLGLTGGVDPEKGVVLLPGKFKDLEDYPIIKLLKDKYALPAWGENDGRLAAYAEKFYGKARKEDWAVVLTLGTGIGSGVILNGEILSDPHLMLGTQVGHLIISKSDDRKCLTGNYGTGEVLCSATALALQVRGAIQRGIPSILTEQYFEDPLSVDFMSVSEGCRAGDALCLNELEVWIDNLAVLLINAIHAYASNLIVLSGGVTNAADLFLEKLRDKVNRSIFRYPTNNKVRIEISDLRQYAGILGAAAMAIENLNLKE